MLVSWNLDLVWPLSYDAAVDEDFFSSGAGAFDTGIKTEWRMALGVPLSFA